MQNISNQLYIHFKGYIRWVFFFLKLHVVLFGGLSSIKGNCVYREILLLNYLQMCIYFIPAQWFTVHRTKMEGSLFI